MKDTPEGYHKFQGYEDSFVSHNKTIDDGSVMLDKDQCKSKMAKVSGEFKKERNVMDQCAKDYDIGDQGIPRT